MKNMDLDEKAAELLRDDLSREEREAIIKSLEEEGLSGEELEALLQLHADIDNVFSGEPGERMDNRFRAMLRDESKNEKPSADNASRLTHSNRQTWLFAAAGIALFVLGWVSASLMGDSRTENSQLADLSGEVRQLKETLVLTMLDQPSTVERIKAVNMIGEFEIPDSRIIENLIAVLNTDNNDNVRLLALEALIKYSDNEEVRAGLIASISEQTSPMIQLRMAELMIAMKEKSSVGEFRKLLNDANLNYSVRSKIQEAVGTLL